MGFISPYLGFSFDKFVVKVRKGSGLGYKPRPAGAPMLMRLFCAGRISTEPQINRYFTAKRRDASRLYETANCIFALLRVSNYKLTLLLLKYLKIYASVLKVVLGVIPIESMDV
ncbi:MAG: hypothetical protein VSS75_027865 [Candidatus Parabeggiatoa sp.]|nr:hypothetical protein [Candidatus Parabeggiatoa sp.]